MYGDNPKIQLLLKKVKAPLQEAWLDCYQDEKWITQELFKAIVWLTANPKRAPKKDFGRFISNWLSRSFESYRKTIPSNRSVTLPSYKEYVESRECPRCHGDGVLYQGSQLFRCDCEAGSERGSHIPILKT